MEYGFCIVNNPNDKVIFQLGRFPPEIHNRLRQSVPSHWRSATWNSQESVFPVRGVSNLNTKYCSMYTSSESGCVRGVPPELVCSVFEIVSANLKNAIPSEAIEENQIRIGTLDALLRKAETKLIAITQWDRVLVDNQQKARTKGALIYRTE